METASDMTSPMVLTSLTGASAFRLPTISRSMTPTWASSAELRKAIVICAGQASTLERASGTLWHVKGAVNVAGHIVLQVIGANICDYADDGHPMVASEKRTCLPIGF